MNSYIMIKTIQILALILGIKGSTPSGHIYKSSTAQIAHTKEWRLMEVESLNWSYFFCLFHFCPYHFYYYGPLSLSSL